MVAWQNQQLSKLAILQPYQIPISSTRNEVLILSSWRFQSEGVDVEHGSYFQLLVNMDPKRTMAKVSIGERDSSRARFRVFLQAF
jgi:hypothetical protein